ncbi:hypothetical protein H180DRAFT_03195 [Streptomyces sp. WMMB 322]|nr:hypothetical protein H180DRAFT_03195 [Streptomyces sp. WMMB 322]
MLRDNRPLGTGTDASPTGASTWHLEAGTARHDQQESADFYWELAQIIFCGGVTESNLRSGLGNY